MKLEDLIKEFRQAGQCSLCKTEVGVSCSRCARYMFPFENYCSHCGGETSVAGRADSQTDNILWTPEEINIFLKDIEMVMSSKSERADKRHLGQDDIDELFA